jgi:Peptidase_C39 like family
MLGWVALAATLFLSGTFDAHVLDLPYRNQLDGSPYALANCGPTSLSMALAYYGIDASTWDLRVRAMQAQHSWWGDPGGYSDRYGVFVYNLATVAESYGVHADLLWARDADRTDHFLRWQPSQLRREIQANHPVIVEVSYRALPAHAGSAAIADHYIVIHGTIGSDFVYSDPLGIGDSGPDEQISEADLMRAMEVSEAPMAGFAVVKP